MLSKQNLDLRVIDILDHKKISKILLWRSKSMTNYVKGYKFYEANKKQKQIENNINFNYG